MLVLGQSDKRTIRPVSSLLCPVRCQHWGCSDLCAKLVDLGTCSLSSGTSAPAEGKTRRKPRTRFVRPLSILRSNDQFGIGPSESKAIAFVTVDGIGIGPLRSVDPNKE